MGEIIRPLIAYAAGLMTSSIIKTVFGSTTNNCKVIDCKVATPLYEPFVKPKVTIDRWFDLTPGYSNQNLWFNAVFTDTNGTKYMYWDSCPQLNQKLHHTMLIDITNQQILMNEYSTDILKLEKLSDTVLTATSSIGVRTTTIDPNSDITETTCDFNANGHHFVFKFQGYPFDYNNGQLATVKEEWFVRGIEIIGKGSGTLDDVQISGFAETERLNWNFPQSTFPGYYWIPFNIANNIVGIFVQVGLYKDAIIWYNGVPYKPINFSINNLGINSVKSDKRIFAFVNIDDTIKMLTLDLNIMQNYNNETCYSAVGYIGFEGNLVSQGNGYAWLEGSPYS